MAKGKYAAIIDKLPRAFGEEPDDQEKINALKREILETVPDPDHLPLQTEALEILLEEVEAMMKIINDSLIQSVAGKRHGSVLARIYRNVRIMKNVYDAQEKITNKIKSAYEQLLVEQYEVEGVTSLGLEDGGSVRVQYEPHGSVTDKEKNRLWAIETGLESMLSLPWQTVNAMTKDALLKGEPEPDGVTATARPKVVYTKG